MEDITVNVGADDDDSPAVFDDSVILEQTEGDREFAKELAQIFIDSSELLLNEIDESFVRNDASTLQRAAHSLKGSVGNFGAPEVWQAAEELELLAERNDLAGAGESLKVLKQRIAGLVDGLRLYISGASS
ncbi:unnamed protein product [marine sediment metagenome]|uniref:HPt domain-containing protein n=1 Tax=marine sediment metagenome TaxID=412755 RepID=X1B006_9ZZZZ